LTRAHRAGRGPRGGTGGALRRVPHRGRGPGGPAHGPGRGRLRGGQARGNYLKAPPEFEALAERLGWASDDNALLAQALAHRSWCAEAGETESNERLEFLGDAVLGLVVT